MVDYISNVFLIQGTEKVFLLKDHTYTDILSAVKNVQLKVLSWYNQYLMMLTVNDYVYK